MLLRLGGRAGEISPLKQNEEENTKFIGSNETLFLKYHTIKARKTFLIKQQILKANTTVRHLTQSAKKFSIISVSGIERAIFCLLVLLRFVQNK